jgi:hypothetical protein
MVLSGCEMDFFTLRKEHIFQVFENQYLGIYMDLQWMKQAIEELCDYIGHLMLLGQQNLWDYERLDGRDKECIKNFGSKTSWKVATWRTEKWKD